MRNARNYICISYVSTLDHSLAHPLYLLDTTSLELPNAHTRSFTVRYLCIRLLWKIYVQGKYMIDFYSVKVFIFNIHNMYLWLNESKEILYIVSNCGSKFIYDLTIFLMVFLFGHFKTICVSRTRQWDIRRKKSKYS